MAKEIQKLEDMDGVKMCVNCEAYTGDLGDHSLSAAMRGQGECIRNPPMPSMSAMGLTSVFPVVAAHCRCLKWKDSKRKFLTSEYAATIDDLAF